MKFHRASITALLFAASASFSWGAPLTLQECLQKARDNNPALKSAAWDSRIARDNSRLAAAATWPRIDGQAGYTVQLEPQAVKMGGVTAETQEPRYAFAGVSATYTIYDFGRRDARIAQADAYGDAAEWNYRAVASDYVIQAVDAYFRILEANRIVQAADDEVTQITEHRRMAQVLFEEGVVTRNDVLQAEVRLASARQKRLSAVNRRENCWLQLNFITGSAPGFRGELVETETVRAGTPGTGDSLDKRHDIKAQQLLIEARDFEVREHRENYVPEIYTRIGMDYVQNDKVREQAIFAATLGIRINLFDGHSARASHEKAVKQRSREEESLRLLEQRARLEIETARNDAGVARERIAVTETAIRQSEENLRINRERYQERVGLASEVLDAQTLVTQTKTDYYRALYDFQTATARLQHALGELN